MKGFEKALKDSKQEHDLNKRLHSIKSNYETNKYDELQTRLTDAESKNEYLSKIIAQLQSKRSAVNFNIGFVFVLIIIINNMECGLALLHFNYLGLVIFNI